MLCLTYTHQFCNQSGVEHNQQQRHGERTVLVIGDDWPPPKTGHNAIYLRAKSAHQQPGHGHGGVVAKN